MRAPLSMFLVALIRLQLVFFDSYQAETTIVLASMGNDSQECCSVIAWGHCFLHIC